MSDNRKHSIVRLWKSRVPVDAVLHNVLKIKKIKKKLNKKNLVWEMGFPHLPRPPEFSLKLWLWEVFSRKSSAGPFLCETFVKPFSCEINTTRVEKIAVFTKLRWIGGRTSDPHFVGCEREYGPVYVKRLTAFLVLSFYAHEFLKVLFKPFLRKMGQFLGSPAQLLYSENENSGYGTTSARQFSHVFHEEIFNL